MAAALASWADPEMPEVMPIEDPSGNLAPVIEALRALGTGAAGRWKVRIGVYGDSNHAMDWPAAALRQRLGEVFGAGGHGFVAASRPWEWYQHTEIAIKVSRQGWRSFAATEPRFHEPHYGHAGLMAIGQRGAWAEFSSTTDGAEDNQHFNSLEISYLCRPKAGRFVVRVDGEVLETIDARCEAERFVSRRFEISPGRHVVRLEVERGRVKFFGAAFENDRPGVVVDGLGCSALSVFRMQQMDPAVFEASLKARGYDMVILHTGSNMWSPDGHPKWMGMVIERIRRALGPQTPILVLSPPDFMEKRGNFLVGHERMAQCTQEKRQIAHDNGLAFWDFYTAMGGLGSVLKWKRRGVVQPDMVHFKPGFHDIMWGRLARALLTQVMQRSPDQARAGSP